MNRRTLLTACGAVLGSSVVGCLEDTDARGDTGGPRDTDTDEPADDSNETATNTASMVSTDDNPKDNSMIRETLFEIRDITPRSQEEQATVTFDDSTIEVSGTIRGRNGCYTARLNDVRAADATLIVDIESYEDAAEDEVCTEANVYIEYHITILIDTEPPDLVTVTHNGERVTTKRPA